MKRGTTTITVPCPRCNEPITFTVEDVNEFGEPMLDAIPNGPCACDLTGADWIAVKEAARKECAR
jgi:hypothetical protein